MWRGNLIIHQAHRRFPLPCCPGALAGPTARRALAFGKKELPVPGKGTGRFLCSLRSIRRGCKEIVADFPYFRPLTKSAMALACSAVTPATAFVCGAFASALPFDTTSAIWSAERVVPLRAGAFIAGFPSPSAPWHAAHFALKSAPPSSAAGTAADIARHKLAATASDLIFIVKLLFSVGRSN